MERPEESVTIGVNQETMDPEQGTCSFSFSSNDDDDDVVVPTTTVTTNNNSNTTTTNNSSSSNEDLVHPATKPDPPECFHDEIMSTNREVAALEDGVDCDLAIPKTVQVLQQPPSTPSIKPSPPEKQQNQNTGILIVVTIVALVLVIGVIVGIVLVVANGKSGGPESNALNENGGTNNLPSTTTTSTITVIHPTVSPTLNSALRPNTNVSTSTSTPEPPRVVTTTPTPTMPFPPPPPPPLLFPTASPTERPWWCCPAGFTGLRPYQNCTQFYQCVQGALVGERTTCSAGTLFNPTVMACDWAANVKCPAAADETDDCNSNSDTADEVDDSTTTTTTSIVSAIPKKNEAEAESVTTTLPPSPPMVVVPLTVPRQDTRLIAYVGSWQPCPTAEQLAQYTHVVLAFAVSYTWTETGNVCSETCDIITSPQLFPVCDNAPNPTLLQQIQAQGIKILVSFGGAGMGGHWDGLNDCWEYCFGREDHVVDQLVALAQDLALDGVDIDYEYYYEDGQNWSQFAKGAQAIRFLRQVTLGLRNQLPAGSLLTHAPIDVDVKEGTAYFDLLKEIGWALDFLMPQYYNGITRPVVDGYDRSCCQRMTTADHYRTLVDELFAGDATRVVFGFCIQECYGTGSNANATQAAAVLQALSRDYKCHGGAFFWVAHDDTDAVWSTTVNSAMDRQRECASTPSIINTPGPSPLSPAAAITLSPTTARPTLAATPPPRQCCPAGFTGLRAWEDCQTFYQCVNGVVVAGATTPCTPGLLFDEAQQSCNWPTLLATACQVDPCTS